MTPIETLSCGFVLVREADHGCYTLMLRAWHHCDFPKGLLEDGEDSLQEEVGFGHVTTSSVTAFFIILISLFLLSSLLPTLLRPRFAF